MIDDARRGDAEEAESPAEEAPTPPSAVMVDLRNFSIRCGHCDQYQTVVAYAPLDDTWNLYTYECDGPSCDPDMTRTYLEVPRDLDTFARRDPAWRGGKRHAGAAPPEET
ncbi:MAG: hypothetical protein AAGN46_16095 [Acidobacteriota bacterium]